MDNHDDTDDVTAVQTDARLLNLEGLRLLQAFAKEAPVVCAQRYGMEIEAVNIVAALTDEEMRRLAGVDHSLFVANEAALMSAIVPAQKGVRK